MGAPPREPLIFAIPRTPTNEYGRYTGALPPNTVATSSRPTEKEEPGLEWSLPPASKSTPSNAQRIGQSTFQTSFPPWSVLRSTVSVCPQSHR